MGPCVPKHIHVYVSLREERANMLVCSHLWDANSLAFCTHIVVSGKGVVACSDIGQQAAVHQQRQRSQVKGERALFMPSLELNIAIYVDE